MESNKGETISINKDIFYEAGLVSSCGRALNCKNLIINYFMP